MTRSELITRLIGLGLAYKGYRQVAIRPIDWAELTKEDQELLQSEDNPRLIVSERNINLGVV